jgi:putative transposase
MGKVLNCVRDGNRKKLKYAKRADVLAGEFQTDSGPITSQHLLISMLLPASVKAFLEEVENEVTDLAGARYAHGKSIQRWGTQSGSVIIGNQHVAIEKPRLRAKGGGEVEIKTYQQFQDPKLFEQAVFNEGIKRVSQRDYEKGVSQISSSFGFKKSSISRKWIKATARKLSDLQERSLKEMNIRAVFIDGKRFKKYGVIIALGVAESGAKFILGIYQAATENHQSCLDLLNDLERRGLAASGLLFIVDGGSGLNKALEIKYAVHDKKNRTAIRVRCFVHKWWNLEAALGDDANQAKSLFWALRDADTLIEARRVSLQLEGVLKALNKSALTSYLEAKEDLLAVHELKLSRALKTFFSTTNPIESLNSLVEEDMRRVKNWKNSEHLQRWLATYCLQNEKRMRRIRGYSQLPGLWIKLRVLLENKNEIDNESLVA